MIFEKSIGSYNEDEDEKNNKKFEYLNDWIEYENKKIKREAEENRYYSFYRCGGNNESRNNWLWKYGQNAFGEVVLK